MQIDIKFCKLGIGGHVHQHTTLKLTSGLMNSGLMDSGLTWYYYLESSFKFA